MNPMGNQPIVDAANTQKCTPREKLWNPSVPGYCFSSRKLGLASGSINVISDFSILILPVPIIWRLQMSKKRKVGITAVFGIGLFACVTSILRLVYSVELQGLPAGATAYQYDIDVIGVWRYVAWCLLCRTSLTET